MPSGDAGERCGVHLLVRVYILRVVRDGDAGRVPELRRRAAAAAAQGMSAPRVGDPARAMLRHTLATVAYRAAKCLRGAPSEFATFRASSDTRTPGEMLAHMGDLIDWAQPQLKGTPELLPVASKWLSADSARFHASMPQLAPMLPSDEPIR